MPTCWAPGCTSGYRTSSDVGRHFFSIPADKIEQWARKIPRKGILTLKHRLCDLHFDEQYIKKDDTFVIDGKSVSLPRDRWSLVPDAVPTLFPNLPNYLSSQVVKRRTLKRNAVAVKDNGQSKSRRTESVPSASVSKPEPDCCSSLSAPASDDHCYSKKQHSGYSRVQDRYTIRKVKQQTTKIKILNAIVQRQSRQITALQKQLEQFNRLPDKMKMIVGQSAKNCEAKSKAGYRFSDEWIIDSLLIRCKSTSSYRMLREGGYLPLPSLSTLNRSLRNLKPEFGFDSNLFDSLAKKLATVDSNERRGILMFDEVQISKNVEFRADTCKIVGMVDYGEITSDDLKTVEGDHALVFLFQPHLSGWIQTVGSFCSSGTTPAVVLSQLLLKCIVLLENSGAIVDGLVCDGASTNRSALGTFGFYGTLKGLKNKMVNPCDGTRNIYFFCDMPHLLKTIRNNLLRSKEFKTQIGTVKLAHFKTLLEHDLNPTTGMRAVPKLTEKHVSPNNFQKMSVSLAGQLFSKSTADAMELYKRSVRNLHDADSTIAFTRKINDIFDLLNARRPVEGIRLNSKRDRLKELSEACKWLDEWERYVATLPVHEQKLFLSQQTCQGLRCTLHSALELSQQLLSNGFSYMLTGKFNQDPLEMFFGMIRQSCGGSDHPTANQFLYAYRLLSANSLIKPPRRASVTTAPVQVLGCLKSSLHQPTVKQAYIGNIEQRLDSLLQHSISDVDEEINQQLFSQIDHDYGISSPEECIQHYLSGYVAHKLRKFTTCGDCVQVLVDNERTASDAKLIMLKTRGLQIPSVPLTRLLKSLEKCIQKYSSKLHVDMYKMILDECLSADELETLTIGCRQHCCALTARCVHFYLVTRLYFLRKACNRNRGSNQQKLSKLSKLT